jgi:phage terminase small subunit
MKDLNSSAAAIRAGYTARSSRTTAARLMAKASIQAFLSELRAKSEKRTEITADKVLSELAYIGFSRIRDIMDTAGDGDIKRDIADSAEAAIQSATIHTNRSKNGESRSVTVKLHDKIRALEKLGSHLGLFNDLNMAMATLRQYGDLEATENGEYIFRPGNSKPTPASTEDEVSPDSENKSPAEAE